MKRTSPEPPSSGDSPAVEFFVRELATLESRIDLLTRSGGAGTEHITDLETAREQLRVADEELRVQRAELDRLIDVDRSSAARQEQFRASIPVALISTDAEGAVLTANPAASELLGIDASRLRGKPLQVFLDPASRRHARDTLATVATHGTSEQLELSITPRGHQSSVTVDAFISRAPSVDARTNGAALTWTIAERRRHAEDDVEASLAVFFANVARLVTSRGSEQKRISSAVELCARALGPGTSVSICMGNPLEPQLTATSDMIAQHGDGAQTMAGEGPVLDTWEKKGSITTPNCRDDARWTRIASYSDLDVACAALPLTDGEDTVGVLAVYVPAERGIDDHLRQKAVHCAAAVSALHHADQTQHQLRLLAHNLEAAMEFRSVIGTAMGLLMAERRCDDQTAFMMLADISKARNVKLRDVAAEIVGDASSTFRRPIY